MCDQIVEHFILVKYFIVKLADMDIVKLLISFDEKQNGVASGTSIAYNIL